MDINKILDDLYTLDPDLRQHEAKLKKLITELLAARPDVHIDQEFAQNLRRQLAAKATLLNKQPINYMNESMSRGAGSAFGGRKLNFVLSGALVVALVVAGAQFYTYQNKFNPEQEVVQLLSSDLQISSTDEQAFGDLNAVMAINSRSQSGGGGMGGDSSNTASLTAPVPDAKMAAGLGGGNSESMIYPPYQPYNFVYKGGDLPELSDQQPVLRRVTSSSNQNGAAQLIKKFSFGLIDINKFKDPKLQNFTLVEDRDYGYIVTVDLTQSSVSIYQNWEKWPQPYANCQDEHCYQSLRIKMDQLPSDQEAIAIAQNFVEEYGISLSGYGRPVVNNDWLADYERSADKASYYIPEQLAVVYPLQLQGKTVLDESGNPTGIVISVDARTKRVNNAYGLMNRKYEQSSYVGETDGKRLISIAEKGGFRNYLPYATEDSNTPSTAVELDTPTIELVQIWKYDINVSQELYVPALVFPVKNNSSIQTYLPKRVIVPLAKELLEQQNGGPVIMYDLPSVKSSVPPMRTEPQATESSTGAE